jgi:hypothetical protein
MVVSSWSSKPHSFVPGEHPLLMASLVDSLGPASVAVEQATAVSAVALRAKRERTKSFVAKERNMESSKMG